MSEGETTDHGAGDEPDRAALRPAERIEDYAIVLAHVRALGTPEAALAALGVPAAAWARASRWSSAMTRATVEGETALARAFGSAFTAETKAIAARADAAAKAAAAAAAPARPEVAP
ncbi:MAG TPA: hypothetical protein VHB21_01390, partial [Minicystis sp.]|nr:hypothetical protein [Minicystis sp.]